MPKGPTAKDQQKDPKTASAEEPRPAAETCASPPDATVDLPETLFVQGNRVFHHGEQTDGYESYATGDYVNALARDLVQGMKPGYGHTLPRTVGKILSLVALRSDMDETAEAKALPQNAEQVPGAAEQMAEALRNEPGAEVLEARPVVLEQELLRYRYIQALIDNTGWFVEPSKIHRVSPLREMDQAIRQGIEAGGVKLKRNPRLRWAIRFALELQKTAEQAVAAERARVAQAADKTPPTDPTKKNG